MACNFDFASFYSNNIRYGANGQAQSSAYDCLVIPNAATEAGVPAHEVCPTDLDIYCKIRMKICMGP